jgi:hypothetical protein
MLFAREGAQVAVADISTKGVEETAELIADGRRARQGRDRASLRDVWIGVQGNR